MYVVVRSTHRYYATEHGRGARAYSGHYPDTYRLCQETDYSFLGCRIHCVSIKICNKYVGGECSM